MPLKKLSFFTMLYSIVGSFAMLSIASGTRTALKPCDARKPTYSDIGRSHKPSTTAFAPSNPNQFAPRRRIGLPSMKILLFAAVKAGGPAASRRPALSGAQMPLKKLLRTSQPLKVSSRS